MTAMMARMALSESTVEKAPKSFLRLRPNLNVPMAMAVMSDAAKLQMQQRLNWFHEILGKQMLSAKLVSEDVETYADATWTTALSFTVDEAWSNDECGMNSCF